MIATEEIRRLLMSFTYQERKKKELNHYRKEIVRLRYMGKDELDLEYINTKTEYEHKKSMISILLLSIVLSVLMDIWKFFYGFIENLLSYYAVPKPNEIEIVQVSIVIFLILIVSISCITLGILISYIRKIRQIYRSLLIIEEIRNRQKSLCNPNGLILGKAGAGKAFHPWDDLKKCKCGGFPWMVGKDGEDYHSGAPYVIKCTGCGVSTLPSGDIAAIRKEWNSKQE